jgi:hypothetical protein
MSKITPCQVVMTGEKDRYVQKMDILARQEQTYRKSLPIVAIVSETSGCLA